MKWWRRQQLRRPPRPSHGYDLANIPNLFSCTQSAGISGGNIYFCSPTYSQLEGLPVQLAAHPFHSYQAYSYDWLLSIPEEIEVISRVGATWPITIYLLSQCALLLSKFIPCQQYYTPASPPGLIYYYWLSSRVHSFSHYQCPI